MNDVNKKPKEIESPPAEGGFFLKWYFSYDIIIKKQSLILRRNYGRA
ncbi:MAG: hypothetical protein QM227_03125 [Bacillota bacterium]|jgi:hypothetical protein|nr:hypothetical protein [Bacillota bacterium]NMB98600.1 hypothetical protein [Clostridiaceae bacterium]